MLDVMRARLDRADLGPARPGQTRQPPPDLDRRLLQQIATGAIWAHHTGWARDPDTPDTVGTYLNPTDRDTANTAHDMITGWRHSGVVAYSGAAGDDGMWRLKLQPAGLALLGDCWDQPAALERTDALDVAGER